MNLWAWVAVMAVVTYLLRAVPLVAFREEVRSPWVRSFLYYVPYAVLTAMTMPAILLATRTPASGIAALVVAVVLALSGRSLITVALGGSLAVLVVELALGLA